VENTEQLYRDNFERVYMSHFPGMVRFACEYVVSKEEAENIVQDAFTDLWDKRRGSLADIKHLQASLFVGIRNRCIDFLRRQIVAREAEDAMQEIFLLDRRMRFDSLEAFDQNILDADDNIEDVVMKAIDALPEKCREIFIKNKLEGKKQKDIADELNISVNTVESQMAIAYKKLRQVLQDYLPVLAYIIII